MASTSKSEPDILQIQCDSEFESESEDGQIEKEEDEVSLAKFTENDMVDVLNKAMQPFLKNMNEISRKVDRLEKTTKKRKYEESSGDDEEEEEYEEENEKRFKSEDSGMFEGEEEVSEEIETRLAEYIQIRYLKNMKAKNLGDLADKYPPPANLKNILKAPRLMQRFGKTSQLTPNPRTLCLVRLKTSYLKRVWHLQRYWSRVLMRRKKYSKTA